MRHVGIPLVAALMAGFLACESSTPSRETVASSSAEEAFTELEERFIQADSVDLDFLITAEGAVEVDLRGHLHTAPDGRMGIAATGVFAGDSVDLLLRAEGDEYEFGNGPGRSQAPRPEFLVEAVGVGFMRMGLLHNLAMLVANQPPDHANGGVREWVQVDSLAYMEVGGEESASRTVAFSIFVGGSPAGTATLELDGQGLPRVRRQTVQFPTGEMRVVERYLSAFIRP
jgi:hypothetical protein